MFDEKLLVVDGYSLLFRAFFATRFMSTTDGRPTNALFGFTSMLFKLIDEYDPKCVVIALDAPGKTFRDVEYAEYKGTRKETPSELIQQLVASRDLIGAMNIPVIEIPGFEADDIVGTLSCHARRDGFHTIIVSGDLDAAQLVNEEVTLITPKVGVSEVSIYTPDAVRERYGFGPEFVPDYKALVGDTSDNIPGVPGVGAKTATKLIQEFGSVESIIARLDDVEEKFRKKLIPGLEQIPKSKWLATIVCDAPVEYTCEGLRLTPEHLERTAEVLLSFEFKSHSRRVAQVFARFLEGGAPPPAPAAPEFTLEVQTGPALRTLVEAEEWVADRPFATAFTAPVVAETLLDAPLARRALLAIGTEVREFDAQLAENLIQKLPGQAILHDAKPLWHGSGQNRPPRFDSMLAGYVLQSGRAQYALRDLIQGYLELSNLDSPELLTASLWHLEAVMRDRLEKEGQTRVLDEIELPLIPVLAEMEHHGVQVNRAVLEDFSKHLEGEIKATAVKVFEIAGQEFSIGSPKQLGEVMFEKMNIPGGKKTKTGWATGAEILVEIDHPIVAQVLSWRELSKLKSTYADALPRMIREDGRIHTTYSQTVAATGRLSSNEPNLQNIPIRTELGRHIRAAFVAAPGYSLVSFDYSQIELRFLAHLCGDEALVTAFQNHEDIHTATASLMFSIEQGVVSKEQRRLAKMLNFAVLYGVTDFGLAQQLGEGFGRTEAAALIEQYRTRFPKVKGFTDAIVAEARQKGYTTTLFGRRRYFPDIHNANRNERMYSERQAMNAPIQGAAADLIKLAMIEVRKVLGDAKSRALLQVHDELLFEIHDSEHHLLEPIRTAMANAMTLSVPIEVDGKIGPNWNEMTPLVSAS